VIGHNRISSELEKLPDEVNETHSKLHLDYKFDNGFDPDRIFYRSDHFNFASKGIPILFFFDGMLSGDYHAPGDTVDRINFDLMSRRTQLIFHLAWALAGRDELLARDLGIE
jgi:Zn-dependent M28 family amino/carboxypeptidase